MNYQNFNANYSNSAASKPDSKPAPEISRESESRGNIIRVLDAEDYQSAAVAAERLWLQEISKSPITASKSNKIRLVSTLISSGADSGKVNTGTEQVQFNLSPEISESKQVIYAEIGDIRQAASILIYGGSPSRKWSINAKFLSRTPEEADATWKSVQLLRSWTNPDTNYKYGIDSGTPHVLRLYGYGRTWQGIPVVLTSLNVDYPTDMDYIPARASVDGTTYEYGTNVPVIQSVSFQLTEARTPDDLLVRFNLEKFKLGVLPEW